MLATGSNGRRTSWKSAVRPDSGSPSGHAGQDTCYPFGEAKPSCPQPSLFDLDSRHRTGTERLLASSRVADARFAGRERPVQHRRLSEARARAQKYDRVSLKVLGTRSG
jgi:hypothetical protein